MYASGPWGPRDDGDDVRRFRKELLDKIRNMLRICHTHEHENLIITSRFSWLSSNEVARAFREASQEIGDTAHLFRRVVFAFPLDDCPMKVAASFRQEFQKPAAGLARLQAQEDKVGMQADSVILDRDGRIVSAACGDFCVSATLGDTFGGGNGCKIWLSRKDDGRYRDNQIWKHGPSGRLVLVACPHLCLSAATRKDVTSRLHLWEMVEVQIRLIKSGYLGPRGALCWQVARVSA